MKIDYTAVATGLRTAGALLIGNSVLIHQGVLGQSLKDADITAAKVLILGAGVLLLCSVSKGK